MLLFSQFKFSPSLSTTVVLQMQLSPRSPFVSFRPTTTVLLIMRCVFILLLQSPTSGHPTFGRWRPARRLWASSMHFWSCAYKVACGVVLLRRTIIEVSVAYLFVLSHDFKCFFKIALMTDFVHCTDMF